MRLALYQLHVFVAAICCFVSGVGMVAVPCRCCQLWYGLVLAACICGCDVLFHVSHGCGGSGCMHIVVGLGWQTYNATAILFN